jgi:GxxExxY protein
MPDYLYEDYTYKIIGALIEVHKNLGKGFSEIVYKDAFEYVLKRINFSFEREKEFSVNYKDTTLKHKFYADFVVLDKFIIEIKSTDSIHEKHISQCLNYLHVSGHRLAILVNFNKTSLEYKRIIK